MKRLLLAVAVVSGVAGFSGAEIPQVIGYQGKVLDNVGNLVPDGDYVMQFRIWNDATGGSMLWDSGEVTESVEGGVFNVMLGEAPHPPLDLVFDEDYWLEVRFDGEPMSPRRQFGSSGYAFMASGLVAGTEVAGGVSGGAAIKASNTAASGIAYGLYGQSHSDQGRGVAGVAGAPTGATCGVYGKSGSANGFGVYGEAATSTSGYGVYSKGRAKVEGELEVGGFRMPTGAQPGYVLTSDALGSASWQLGGGGSAYADTAGYAHLAGTIQAGAVVSGAVQSDSASAITGVNAAVSGVSYGIRGISSSDSGIGVRGSAEATTGPTYGVIGKSSSPGGRGVYGFCSATTGGTYGVYGQSYSAGGVGVYGRAAASSGGTYAVRGDCMSSAGAGVYGNASSSVGATYGVYGRSSSSDGYGVYSEGNAQVVGTLEVNGFSMPTGAADGYFLVSDGSGNATWTDVVPGTDDGDWDFSGDNIYRTTGNVGIGTAGPEHKLHVAGRLAVEDTDAQLYLAQDVTPNSEDGHYFRSNGGSLTVSQFTDGVKADWLTIDGTGKVGIGATSPSAPLHVNSANLNTAALFESADPGVVLELKDNETTGSPQIQVQGDDLMFRTTGANRVYVTGDGNVGVGTTYPDAKLHAVADATTAAVKGINVATTGENYGLHGESESTIGKGVRGYATAGSGPTVGVDGRSDSPDGTGVHGYAFSGEGVNYGVYGKTNSSEGYGVYSSGDAKVDGSLQVDGFTMPTGAADGYFLVCDGSGNGAWTEAAPESSDGDWNFSGDDIYRETGNVGVGTATPDAKLHAVSDGTTAAVKGISTATAGESYGLHGESESTIGKGVRGHATAVSGPTVGVDGRSDSPEGMGVHGFTVTSEGVNYGVYGKTNSPDGYGVYSDGAAKVAGDFEITGAYKGNIGPNSGGVFPRPAYDSGWVSVQAGHSLQLNHNIGGNVDSYVVDMQFQSGTWGRNVHCFGGADYVGVTMGARWYALTDSSIWVLRDSYDGSAEQLRIRIWVYN